MIRALLLALAVGAAPLTAQEAPEDPALAERAEALNLQLRCLVCQNQSIAESNADLAKDMRAIVLERLEAGDGDEEVIDYLRARYGDYVTLKPPVKPSTWALWFGPLAFLGVGALLMARQFRKSAPVEDGEAAGS